MGHWGGDGNDPQHFQPLRTSLFHAPHDQRPAAGLCRCCIISSITACTIVAWKLLGCCADSMSIVYRSSPFHDNDTPESWYSNMSHHQLSTLKQQISKQSIAAQCTQSAPHCHTSCSNIHMNSIFYPAGSVGHELQELGYNWHSVIAVSKPTKSLSTLSSCCYCWHDALQDRQ